MTHLIKKNLGIHKYQWIAYSFLLFVFLVTQKDAVFIISFVSAVIVMNEFHFDEKANGDKLWNSLPFTRKEVVSSKYISLLLAILFCMSFVIFVESFYGSIFNLAFWKQVAGSIILGMFSGALFFPVFYKFSQRKIMFFLLIMYVLLVLAGSYGFYHSYLYIYESFISQGIISDLQLFGVSFAVSILLYILSWRVSVSIYNRKDIN